MVVEKRNNGISLISLIITIIVIIILAAIVIFSGMDTPEKAQLSKVISDIDNVQTAVDQAYYGLYTEKAVAGEVWTPSQFYEAVATGEKNRDNLTGTGLIEIGENSLVDINLPKYEGRKWYIAVSDVSDTIKTGSAVLSPGFESQGKTYATLLDIQTGGSDGSGTNGGNGSDETFVAVEPTNVNDWEWEELEDGTLCITKYSGTDTEVVIPNSINGKRVRTVGGNNGLNSDSIWAEDICEPEIEGYYDVLYYQTTISKITISYGIEQIGDDAFKRSSNLEEIVIPNSIKSIGDRAFFYCTKLNNAIIPNSVIYIGDSIFYACQSLTNVVLPDNITSIPDYTFSGCFKLTNVIIPTNVTYIGEMSFQQCYYIQNISIPNGVTYIARYAFNMAGLNEVTIPSSVNYIGHDAFSPNVIDSLQIICKFSEKPSAWDDNWATSTTRIYWQGE